jgi:hypothetical protein
VGRQPRLFESSLEHVRGVGRTDRVLMRSILVPPCGYPREHAGGCPPRWLQKKTEGSETLGAGQRYRSLDGTGTKRAQEGLRHLESVYVSPLFGGQRCSSLLKCVVGSHQASFLPSEEEPFAMDNIS